MCFLFTIRKTAPWTLLPAPWPGICTSLTKKSFHFKKEEKKKSFHLKKRRRRKKKSFHIKKEEEQKRRTIKNVTITLVCKIEEILQGQYSFQRQIKFFEKEQGNAPAGHLIGSRWDMSQHFNNDAHQTYLYFLYFYWPIHIYIKLPFFGISLLLL